MKVGSDSTYCRSIITARRTHISPPASGSDGCRGGHPPGTRNASSPRMVRWLNTCDLGAIVLPRPPTAKRCSKGSRCGVRSRARGWLPQSSLGLRLVRSRPSVASRRDPYEEGDNVWERPLPHSAYQCLPAAHHNARCPAELARCGRHGGMAGTVGRPLAAAMRHLVTGREAHVRGE